MPFRKAWVLLTVSALALTALGLATIAQSNSGADDAMDGKPRAVSAFGAAGPRVTPPPAAASELRLARMSGLELDGSVIAQALDGWRLYLTPATAATCLSLTDPSGGASVTCRRDEDLLANAEQPSSVLSGCKADSPDTPPVCDTALLYGLVPDGVDAVEVSYVGGKTQRVDVAANTYMIGGVPLDHSPESIAFVGGKRSAELSIEYLAVRQ